MRAVVTRRRLWRRLPPGLRRGLVRVREVFPLTTVGLLLGSGSALALLHYGLRRLDLVLLVIGAVGSALVLLSLLATSITALVFWLRLRRELANDGGEVRLECGRQRETGFSLRHLWFVPLVNVSWTWRSPEARVEVDKRRGRLFERIVPTRRALADRVERQFEVVDIFGFARVVFPVTQRRTVHFVPSVGSLRHMEVVHSMSGGQDLSHPDGPPEGERVDIRSYNTGDPVRFILWKVFARTRQVVVRTPERAIGPVRQTVAYLVSGQNDEPAAGAARVAVESGALGGDWVLGADGDPEPARSRDAALTAVSASASTPVDQQGAGLTPFLTQAVPGAKLARALVFVPAVPGPWIDRVVAAAGAAGAAGRLDLVVCCDGIVKSGVISRVGRALREPELPADPSALRPASLEDLGEVLRQLSRTRCKLMVVDRQTGQVFSEGHLTQMLRAA